MKLEDIKKMSDEEFIEFVNKFRKNKGKISLEEFMNENKLTIISSSFAVCAGLGFLFLTFYSGISGEERFIDSSLNTGIAFFSGFVAGVPLTKKLFRCAYGRTINFAEEGQRQELIELKKDIENLTDEDLSFVKSVSSNHNLYELHERIEDVFSDDDPNKFIDSLEVIYKDDKEDLGYSKNISKNN